MTMLSNYLLIANKKKRCTYPKHALSKIGQHCLHVALRLDPVIHGILIVLFEPLGWDYFA